MSGSITASIARTSGPALDRIKRSAGYLRIACAVLVTLQGIAALLLLVMALWPWIASGGFPAIDWLAKLTNAGTVRAASTMPHGTGMPFPMFLHAIVISLILLYAYSRLFVLFDNLREGSVFSRDNVHALRRTGYALLVVFLIGGWFHVEVDMVRMEDLLPGQDVRPHVDWIVNVGSEQVRDLLLIGLAFLSARVLDLAATIGPTDVQRRA